MKKYMEALTSYLQKNPITFDTNTSTPCLETLWWHYAGFHPIQSDQTKNLDILIRKRLDRHNLSNAEEVLDLIGSLCTEYEKLAFTAGMKLGMQLMMEAE